jgi:DNA-binding transcriptional LysR family regulator
LDDVEALLQAALAGLGIIHRASRLVRDMLSDGKLLLLFDSPVTSIGRH